MSFPSCYVWLWNPLSCPLFVVTPNHAGTLCHGTKTFKIIAFGLWSQNSGSSMEGWWWPLDFCLNVSTQRNSCLFFFRARISRQIRWLQFFWAGELRREIQVYLSGSSEEVHSLFLLLFFEEFARNEVVSSNVLWHSYSSLVSFFFFKGVALHDFSC